MDQKFSSIQELESINLKDYKNKPEELIQMGKYLLKAKRFEKSIEVFEEALKQSIVKRNNDEFSIECAIYYYYYADALIYKLQESGDIFQNPAPKVKNDGAASAPNENNNFENTKQNVDKEDIKITNISEKKEKSMIEEEEEKKEENILKDINNYEISNESDNEEGEEEEESDEKL